MLRSGLLVPPAHVYEICAKIDTMSLCVVSTPVSRRLQHRPAVAAVRRRCCNIIFDRSCKHSLPARSQLLLSYRSYHKSCCSPVRFSNCCIYVFLNRVLLYICCYQFHHKLWNLTNPTNKAPCFANLLMPAGDPFRSAVYAWCLESAYCLIEALHLHWTVWTALLTIQQDPFPFKKKKTRSLACQMQFPAHLLRLCWLEDSLLSRLNIAGPKPG